MRVFVVGGILVIAAAVAIRLWLLPDPPAPAADTPLPQAAPTAGQPEPAGSAAPAGDIAEERAPLELPAPRASSSPQPSSVAAAVTPADPGEEPDASDWREPCRCYGDLIGRLEAEAEAVRQAEPKDVAWAYDTEQLLEQYIVAHPSAGDLRLDGVDCRTSFCAISVTVTDESWSALDEIVEAAMAEPWNTFSARRRTSYAEDGDRHNIRALIERAPTSGSAFASALERPRPTEQDYEACPCARPEARARRSRLREAALEAEPRDIDWAYATELRLQNFIAGHPRASAFEVTGIECRTTYCDVSAKTLTEGDVETFVDVVTLAARQEGTGLTRAFSAGSESVGDEIQASVRLHRQQ